MSRGIAGGVDDAPHAPEGRRAGAFERVTLGSRVTIRRGILMSDVSIVSAVEADVSKSRIAWDSPLARALEGAVRGDVVELEAGGRVEEVRVLAVTRGDG